MYKVNQFKYHLYKNNKKLSNTHYRLIYMRTTLVLYYIYNVRVMPSIITQSLSVDLHGHNSGNIYIIIPYNQYIDSYLIHIYNI